MDTHACEDGEHPEIRTGVSGGGARGVIKTGEEPLSPHGRRWAGGEVGEKSNAMQPLV